MSDGGNFAIKVDGQSIITDHCGSLDPNAIKYGSGSGTFTATATGLVPVEIYNWRSGTELDPVHNYVDNVRVMARTFNFEADSRELDTYNGSTSTLKLTPGPAYANKWYIILQGASGPTPGFDMNMGTVHIPLNPDAWTWIALSLNPLWTGFYSQLDGQGEATAVFDTFGPQYSAWAVALHFAYVVLENPGDTPIFASNSIYTLFVVM